MGKGDNAIIQIARISGFIVDIIHSLNNKIKQQAIQPSTNHTCSPNWWVSFTHQSPLMKKVINLFKNTNIDVTFQTTSTICNLIHT
jgi:hypothetical protein